MKLINEENISFLYTDFDSVYLKDLQIESGIKKTNWEHQSTIEKVLKLQHHVFKLLNHGNIEYPVNYDPLSIIKTSKKGEGVRCVEYCIVLAALLQSIGIYARKVDLIVKDADIIKSNASHSIVEAFDLEFKKWIMLDPQNNIIPISLKNNQPLNALELKKILDGNNINLKLLGVNDTKLAINYLRFLKPYLYYFHVNVYQIYDYSDVKITANKVTPTNIYLKPKGSKDLQMFQKRFPIQDALFTELEESFYQIPTKE
ncbi:transglutaminase-like domain-containing protein [Bacillus cereus]|uniref:transglutaminase-like domain-containing protein n=1 Tax=Bacillus cereus TaxID=1396 RepID=UPI000BF332BC|nr:transglutaminase-like domain-containing protein [Bacillus cereus]PFR32461.1 hypothetical protein COK20_30335 [Bacillus cereus]PFW21712.1 hypothetical protein COL07_28880 [Bacillus cereus]PGT07221.1 hypothetical protein COD03_27195 [Bacillus cereus]